ncbi:hypothetical protein Q5762_07305 [Streptomyces sp. P9(2023)]|uniref:hypothetical protein n=1 Tax=Streptomyces sp. P9(2023) TaxID=3064394 RepID=UPI0028F3F79B|nr:hypothetical protein [Streptomyces sp. P9(2023)]MDT9688163.1 hypothetical protein [Streptomyces sp. P9(2023)]
MTGPQRITGALYIDCGQQLQNLTWARHPRAKYECLLCHTTEGPVVGEHAVKAFVPTIRATHHQTHHQQGAQAA